MRLTFVASVGCALALASTAGVALGALPPEPGVRCAGSQLGILNKLPFGSVTAATDIIDIDLVVARDTGRIAGWLYVTRRHERFLGVASSETLVPIIAAAGATPEFRKALASSHAQDVWGPLPQTVANAVMRGSARVVSCFSHPYSGEESAK